MNACNGCGSGGTTPHTHDCLFGHFLDYQNWRELSWATKQLLRVAYEHAARDATPKWRPIDSAPMDGTPLMLFARHVDAEAPIRVVGWYIDGEGWIDSAFRPNRPQRLAPSHWMPLLEFPKS
ncbi:hypothetical protein BGLT_05200 [Caballeronia glathei]|uniref:DUF551 domain-containing protein n=1 Tax=Caballeronia glathei TaxID=60547 RepID=A0A069PF75_9BURK|nr:hypothetical protein [Caballeronia glathei]KDR39215.1 hypothetical protein BG61_34285 [Caballeronia glathei]CDY76128.1 hypothetical protein BGLT_05200 [Caballeronia glathei]